MRSLKNRIQILSLSTRLLLVSMLAFSAFEASIYLGSLVAAQFDGSGILFSNANALASRAVAGSVNELAFPPHSGRNVVVNDGGRSRLEIPRKLSGFSFTLDDFIGTPQIKVPEPSLTA